MAVKFMLHIVMVILHTHSRIVLGGKVYNIVLLLKAFKIYNNAEKPVII